MRDFSIYLQRCAKSTMRYSEVTRENPAKKMQAMELAIAEFLNSKSEVKNSLTLTNGGFNISAAVKRGDLLENAFYSLKDCLETTFLNPISTQKNEDLNILNSKRESETREALFCLCINFFTVFILCSFSLYRAVKNPASVANFSSATSVLTNPALNAIGSLLVGYGALKLAIAPYYSRKSTIPYNSGIRELFSENNIREILESTYKETAFAKEAAQNR